MTHPYPTVFSDFEPQLIADCNADCHCTPEFMEEMSSFHSNIVNGYYFWLSEVLEANFKKRCIRNWPRACLNVWFHWNRFLTKSMFAYHELNLASLSQQPNIFLTMPCWLYSRSCKWHNRRLWMRCRPNCYRGILPKSRSRKGLFHPLIF